MKLRKIYEKSNVFGQSDNCLPGQESGKRRSESLFVSGIVLREVLCPHLEFSGTEDLYSFEQLWYALCLHHNLQYEKKGIWESLCRKRSGIETDRQPECINTEWGRKWSPMEVCVSPMFVYEREVFFTNGASRKKSEIQEADMTDCFYYRAMCSSREGMDHGIAGGLLLYEDLMNRDQMLHIPYERSPKDLYSYLATTLMSHNIWKEREQEEPLAFEEDPLLFLLLLAETLEPLQYETEYKTGEKLLDEIEVELHENEVSISVGTDRKLFEQYVENMIALQEIIRIRCNIEQGCEKICIRMSNVMSDND